MTDADEQGIFELMVEGGHESLVYCSDPDAGYRGVIAVHDTTLGPSLGGTRYWPYENERAAVLDALRLSRAMTYKAAVADLALGGGKSVVWSDPSVHGREAVFRAHGRAIDALGGRYVTAADVGTTQQDMAYIATETEHVTGMPGSADTSVLTGYGVYRGIAACVAFRYGDDDLTGRHVAVQGVGKVGYHLCENLAEAGARLTVTDSDPERVRRAVSELGASAVPADEILDVEADVFAPCALGGVIDDDSVGRLRADIVAGGANNQLADSVRHALALHQRGILYAPDYVVNAGGLISVFGELSGWSADRTKAKVGDIHQTLLRIFETAKSEGVPTDAAAGQLARERIRKAKKPPTDAE